MQSTGNMNNNKLIIAAAGSGKTTYLIEQALKVKEENALITTYTEANEEEIRKKFIEKKGLYSAQYYHSNLVFFFIATRSKTISKCNE